MDSIESLGAIFLIGICLLTYIAVFVTIAIVSTKAKYKSAKRILKAQARGAFADLETPNNKSRFRLLAGIALIGALGMVFSFVILVLQLTGRFAGFYGVTVVAALIFGVTSSIAGLLINREINRRL